MSVQSLLLRTKRDNSHNSNNPQDTCLVMFRHFMAHHKAYLLPLDLRKNVFCATCQDNVWIQYLIVNFRTNLNALLRCNIIYGDGNIIMEKKYGIYFTNNADLPALNIIWIKNFVVVVVDS